METVKNIQKISVWFFVILGTAYILSGLTEIGGFFKNESFVIHQTIQIPFIIVALAYGGSSLASSIANPEKNNRILFVSVTLIGLSVLIATLVLEILFPDINAVAGGNIGT